MAMFVHLAAESFVARIRRRGIARLPEARDKLPGAARLPCR
jgi:hypothetical protein